MFDEKFGLKTKKRVKYDGHTINIGNHVISELKLHCIYVRPFDFLKNEWGSVYFSVNGEDYDPNDLLAKNVFKYTKKQTEKVWEFLNMLDVEIIQVDSDFNKASDQTKLEKKERDSVILCHHCGSKDIQFMQNNRKNFSVGKAAAGAALTGGVGTLAGFAGKKGDNEFFCKSCNRTFKHKIK